MTQPVLEIQALDISLPRGADRARAVAQVSLTVNPGEIVCLVGESGSGKSAIAHTVMGLQAKALVPTAGQILLQGEDVLTMAPARLRQLRCTTMSMIFQEPMTALNPVFSCGEQIDEVLRTHTALTASERQARVLDMIQQVGLPDPLRMLRSYPHQLSGGQRQRIMIAMALVLKPLLLIADEPTTALDATIQEEVLLLHCLQQLILQVRFAKRAVSTGGFFGKGYLSGPLTNGSFIPVQSTDFIFSAIGEQFGMLGGGIVLGLFGVVLWRIYRTAQLCQDRLGTLLCAGVFTIILWQAFQNLGMTMGITPVSGVPLPFVSYGGSHTVAFAIMIGLVQSVHMRRFR